MISSGSVSRVRSLYLRVLGLCYAVALHSLYVQLPGLYGDSGVMPASSVVNSIRSQNPQASPWTLALRSPSLLWLQPLTGLSVLQCMELLCLLGTLIGVIITLVPGYATKLTMFLLWLVYISLYQVGQTFLHFQWDILLLEAGMLGIIVSPLWPGQQRRGLAQDRVTMFLVRWLLFRMMFASGVVKLTSGCDAWWGLSAMPTHYFSQCLPTPLSWYAANLQPEWMHRLSVLSTFIIEIPLTFLFFAPTSALRKMTFFCQVFLMVVIMLTGNYNFFNFLFMGLCLSLADDSWLRSGQKDPHKPKSHPVLYCAWCLFHLAVCVGLGWAIGQCVNLSLQPDFSIQSSLAFSRSELDTFLCYSVPAGAALGAAGLLWAILVSFKVSSRGSWPTLVVYSSLALALFTLSLPSYAGQLDRQTYEAIPTQVKLWHRKLSHLELHHSYGLFRSMTGIGGRPEVILEGADTLEGPWTEYHFRYKPGNTSWAPRFVLPHQPRLDWQMWFAALGSYNHNPWLLSLVYRLLEGRREVLDLLDPDTVWAQAGRAAPLYIRAQLYTYTFTQGETSHWWRREQQRTYLPELSLENRQLVEILRSEGLITESQDEPGVKSPVTEAVTRVLESVRRVAKLAPAEAQIWTYAWLALPMFKPFVI